MSDYWRNKFEGRTEGGHRYRSEQWFKKSVQEHLFHIGEQANRQNVLVDIGCGAAELTVYYAPFFKKIYGFDFSSSMLQAAQKRVDSFNIDNIELIQGDACDFAEKIKTADIIISTQVVQFLSYEQLGRHLDESLKILNPKGSIFIFWIIDPKTEWLWDIGYLSDNKIGLPQLILRLLFRQKQIISRKLQRKPGTTELGYSHAKEKIKAICSSKNLEVEFSNALYLEYRYNASIKRKA